jgi:hypothetical protein
MATEGTIVFDIDGVLANFTRGFTRIAHVFFGTPVGDAPSQQNWMFEDFPELGLTKEHCDFNNGLIWNEVRTNNMFWENLDPLNPSVMLRINAIQNKMFITNRLGVDPLKQSEWFLKKWGIADPLVVLASKKAPVAAEYHCVAMLDDYYPNCTEVKDALKNAFVCLHYAPYNKIHHDDWRARGGDVTLSVDHFINECEKRDLVVY